MHVSSLLRASGRNAPLFNMSLGADDVAIARDWLRNKGEWNSQEQVDGFERAFASWNGTAHAVGFMAARVALSAALHALRLQPGDEVILPGYTCIVVPNALRFAGIVPVFADVELDTYGLDASRFQERIGPRTRAVLLHHLYGLAARDYQTIVDIARARGIAVIEDCAQAAGVEWRGHRVGNLGDVAIFSTEQSKHLNTIQGGLVLTNDDVLAHRLRQYQQERPYPESDRVESLLRTVILAHARTSASGWRRRVTVARYASAQQPSTTEQEIRGERPPRYGERMSSAIAALGLNQLSKVDELNRARRIGAERWNEWCRTNGYQTPLIVKGSVPTYLRYPVLVEPERKLDRSWAAGMGVDVGVWFQGKLHPVDEHLDGCDRADEAVARCINFPCLTRRSEGW